jgi:protein-S-isoprenylcysteine O-methyltransferase Ste14
MHVDSRVIFAVIWVGWVMSWLAASFWTARTQKRAGTLISWIYRILLGVGAVLMTPWAARFFAATPLWHVGDGGSYLLATATLAGIALTWWARIYLGRLWSSAIRRKEDHRIVESGPYALVRHPIYSGLIAAILATAIAEATATALIGLALIVFGLWVMARAEERFLTDELGGEAYAAYRRRVPMLMPRLWRR